MKLAAQFVGTLLPMGLVGHYLYVIVAVVAIWGLTYLGDRTAALTCARRHARGAGRPAARRAMAGDERGTYGRLPAGEDLTCARASRSSATPSARTGARGSSS